MIISEEVVIIVVSCLGIIIENPPLFRQTVSENSSKIETEQEVNVDVDPSGFTQTMNPILIRHFRRFRWNHRRRHKTRSHILHFHPNMASIMQITSRIHFHFTIIVVLLTALFYFWCWMCWNERPERSCVCLARKSNKKVSFKKVVSLFFVSNLRRKKPI